jgi:hypothetical protein
VLHHNLGPWLCMGDFNEILLQQEKQGSVPRPQWCMDRFRMALEECGLDDLGFSGDTFTWRNHSHTIEGYIRERLDRAVGNLEWCGKFLTYEIVNGDPRHSEHRPIIVHVQGEKAVNVERMGPSVFKFEANWLKEEKCANLVQEAWVNSFQFGSSSVSEGLKDISWVMTDWSKNILGDLEKRIKRLKKDLAKCIKGPLT